MFARVLLSSSAAIASEVPQLFTETVDIGLEPPELRLRGPAEIAEGATASVRFTMVNPLRAPLTDISLHAESDGLLDEPLEMELDDVGGKSRVSGL